MKSVHVMAALASLASMLVSSRADATKLIAVLPLDVRNTAGKMNPAAEASVEEMLRDVAANVLTSEGWVVLTGETMLQVLQDNGIDPAKCGDQTCHLSMAREIKAEKFLSGTVQYVEGQFTASIRLIDTRTGSILASERISAPTVTGLRTAFESKAIEFFVRARMVEGKSSTVPPAAVTQQTPDIHRETATRSVGSLTITAKPREGVRLELTMPGKKTATSGVPYRNDVASPGAWHVKAVAAGFEETERDFDVPADDETLIKLELRELSSLSVTGAPTGAAVVVTGPTGFKDNGGLPWSARNLNPGEYRVQVSRDGYQSTDQTTDVAPGASASIDVQLVRVAASAEEAQADSAQTKGMFVLQEDVVYDKTTSLTWQRRIGHAQLLLPWPAAKSYCDHLYLHTMVSGWRLPTIEELRTLLTEDLGKQLDDEVFPNTPGDWFWTTTADYQAGSQYISALQFVRLAPAYWMSRAKDQTGDCRCVHEGPPPAVLREKTRSKDDEPTSHGPYSMTEATVRDSRTELVWQRKLSGTTYQWRNASTACSRFGKVTHSAGWHLPTLDELNTIVDRQADGVSIDRIAFPDTPEHLFWTSTPSRGGTAQTIHFAGGRVQPAPLASSLEVRCVRGRTSK